jgi:hypothetical protein
MPNANAFEWNMKFFKYCCAILALAYLVTALLPAHLLVPQHSGLKATVPEWVGRALSIADFLLLAAMFYGVQKRKPIYWRLIPVLLGIFLLSVVIPTLWSLIRLSLPWAPFMFIVVFFFIGALFFGAWWRNQKNYFA